MDKDICPDCGGDKVQEAKHPAWGTSTCVEAFILAPCPTCDGTGEVDPPERDELPNCVWRDAETPFAENY